MPGPFTSQIGRVTTGLLNTVNDALPAQIVSSGTGLARYTGQLGQRVALGPDEVKFSSTIGTLYGGVYQYVKFKEAGVIGQLRWWDVAVAENLYQTTTLEPTGGNAFAGVALCTVTAGNYGWIQIMGKATVQYRATIGGTKAVGVVVVMALAGAGADNATADTATDATAVSATILKTVLGQAEVLPVNGALGKVNLWTRAFRI